MEYGSIEREIHIDASPEVVFEVVSRPEHIMEWWADEADFEATPGSIGELAWGDRENVVPMSVVKVDPPRLFSFRWCYADGKVDDLANALLVTFELIPSGTGTTVRLTETGFREMGWEEAKLAAQYQDHVVGWNTYIPGLGEYAARLVSAR
ncbi:SRPBCC domain-containing protein [Spongiactinospora sp. TRM90649]|uniref:SRPBCC domain-containing protein n=1 Tax=Spongiactinospora sp. TRM90649 TaxID=3031114 RepID=UPI0023F62FAA|nr:SRPBCC domain-containing protein [Spongiactinospora sp. TRM90649]MDF5751848.1 SRPBCC domain-containing protein [Spongiactinospora sp. TRM90649]